MSRVGDMSGKDVLIRDFRKSDLDDLLELLPKCFAEEFEISGFDSGHIREMVGRAYGVTGTLFLGASHLVGKDPIRFFVAGVENKVVGTALVNRDGRVGYISTVMVAPEHRGKGIATNLVKSAVEHIRKARMERAVLHVVTTNAPAIGVYSKIGFGTFERIAYLVGDAGSLRPKAGSGEIETRPYKGADLHDAADLYVASEERSHLKVFGFDRNQLKTPLWMRLFSFATQKRLVAVRAGKVVGSVEVAWTTPKEAASISSLHVRPQERSGDIESALASAAIDEIRSGGVEKIIARAPVTRPELIETLRGIGFREELVLAGMSKETA